MKLAAVCCTYKRPHLLGQLIESFLRQDYPKHLRELVILADDGLYDYQEGDGWRIIPVPRRFNTLGEKRNTCAALASADADAFCVADDDDIYLPHWLSTQAQALASADWSVPSLVLVEDRPDQLREAPTGGLYHGGWAYRRELFHKLGGYRAFASNGEDQELAGRFHEAGARIADPSEFSVPFYYYRDLSGSYHLSWLGDGHAGYRALANQKTTGKAAFAVGWPRDFTALPVKRLHPPRAVHVAPPGGKYAVELIGVQGQGGRDGPSQGMFALQAALRARLHGPHGLPDWLTIRSRPPTPGCLAWFWNWQDRGDLVRWDQQGHPSIVGPNVIFYNSATPGAEPEERRVLDAKHCRGFFCHSAWYAEHIARHTTSPAPIFQWPYPIDSWPGEPLPDEYDLLIYGKNGHRPGLLEHLAKAFPRHVQIHYGSYHRGQLFGAARKSRACAYLADDDHGPLALEEIQLAGCPTIGVRTGASLITDGVTGKWVPRLPPGEHCIANDQHRADLGLYLDELRSLMDFDRQAVRAEAARRFDTNKIVDDLIGYLEQARS